MWILNKTKKNQKKKVKWINPFIPVLIFIIGFLILFLGDKILGTNKGMFYPTTGNEWKDVIEKIPKFMIMSLIFTTSITIMSIGIKQDKRKMYICDRCNKIIYNGDIKDCECGGTFYDGDLMKWVDDDELPNTDEKLI